MHKKIILFVIGLAASLGLFGIYRFITGTPIIAKPYKPMNTTQFPEQTTENTNVILETRDETGALLSLLSARKVVEHSDGRADVEGVIYARYDKSGRRLIITADSGTIISDRLSPKSLKVLPKEGTLSGNVTLTEGPENSFKPGTSDLQPNQIQARLEKDVHFQFDSNKLTSEGRIQVRSDRVSFDGRDMTLQIGKDQRTIEFLQIVQGDKVILKNVGKEGFDNLDKPADAPAGVPANTTPAPPPAQVAAADAAKSGKPPVVYKLHFSTDIVAKLGTRKLTSDQLDLLFQSGANDAVAPAPNEPKVIGINPPTGGRASTEPLVVAPPKPVEPMPATGPDDLEVTWSGQLTMRPLADGQVSPLANAKDRQIEAIGSVNRPVVISDGDTVVAKAGIMHYWASQQRALLEPGEYQRVEASDTTKGSLVAREIEYLQGTNEIHITGPGKADVLPTTIRRNAQPGTAPLHAEWKKAIDVTLAKVPDSRDKTKSTLAIKHAAITGEVTIKDPEFTLNTDKLDASMTSVQSAGKETAALERLLCDGNVLVQAFRTAPDGTPLQPDFIRGKKLELTTAVRANSPVPQPDRLRVDGDVLALTWQPGSPDETGKKIYSRQQIETPLLIVDLMQKDKAAATAPGDIAGGIGVKTLSATNGVKLTLEGISKDPVIATSAELHADAVAGTAELLGSNSAGAVRFAHIYMGDNQISGMLIKLNQKAGDADSITIPGNGEFIFQQPPAKPGDAPQPVRVAWTDHMSFNSKTNLATFVGNASAMLIGKADQESQLKADTLLVKLAASAAKGDKPAAGALDPNSAAGRKLQEITALGHVTAAGATFDPKGDPLTRLILRDVEQLVYTEASKTMRITGKGKMGIEDYRPDPAAAKNNAKPNGARGVTAFTWAGGLTYVGDTGLITFTKDVMMRHKPTTPIMLDKNQKPGTEPQMIQLLCQNLNAVLITTKETTPNVASPVALGNNGQVKVSRVTAISGAQLTVDQNVVSGDTLDFDALKNIAIVSSTGENWASLLRPPVAIAYYRSIIWNFTTGDLKAREPQLQMIVPSNGAGSGLSPIPSQP